MRWLELLMTLVCRYLQRKGYTIKVHSDGQQTVRISIDPLAITPTSDCLKSKEVIDHEEKENHE